MRTLAPLPFLVLLASFLPASVHAGEDPPAGKELPPPKVRFGGLVQTQWDAGDVGDARFSGDETRFYLRRARLSATATFAEGFEAKLEAELAGTLADTSNLRAQLTDAYVAWVGDARLQARAGQFKTPFGVEQLLSDRRMSTIERSLGSDRLTPGRQVGVQAFGDLLGKRLSWAVGAFNGTGPNTTANSDGKPLLAARIAGTAWRGSLGGAEATLTAGVDGFASSDEALALPPDLGFDSTPGTPAPDNLFTGRREAAGVDLSFRAGRLEAWAEGLLVRYEPDSGIPRPSVEATSVALLAGYEVVPKKLHLVARLDRFDPDRDRDADDTTTLTLGGSWYFRGHDLKLQLNYLASDVPDLGRQDKLLARIQAAF